MNKNSDLIGTCATDNIVSPMESVAVRAAELARGMSIAQANLEDILCFLQGPSPEVEKGNEGLSCLPPSGYLNRLVATIYKQEETLIKLVSTINQLRSILS